MFVARILMLPKLPLDLSTFSELRKQNYLYIDKTKYAYDLITGGRRFFLSRPRRFGKTLFVSTLKEILTGNKVLFDGLWIEKSDYHWQPYGVITLDLSSLGIENAATLKVGLKEALIRAAHGYDLTLNVTTETPEFLLYNLVKALKKTFGRVALLIDEYDNPILRALKNTDLACEIRDGIRSFFAAVKGLDSELDFVFITGVSNFAKAGLFSGLNNLQVVTLDDRFACVCGYTQEEIIHSFKDYLAIWSEKENISLDALQTQIKYWYNGYRFSSKTSSVYNPFSLMKAFASQSFKNFWFQSGAPTFLVKELEKEYRKNEYRLLNVDNLQITEDTLGIFDVGATPLASLMFQTGYLTIVDYDRTNDLYKLGYPNFEVKTALQKHMLAILTKIDFASADQISNQLKIALNNGAIDEVIVLLKQLFFNVPYQLQIKEEKFYHAVLQTICDAAGIKTQSEYPISHGRIDLKLELPNWLYIIEIKLNKSAESALEQIEQMRYHELFIKEQKPIILLGLSFHRTPKNFDITYKEKRLPVSKI